MTRTIRVLERDITGAEPMTCENCPVARALRRQGFPSAMVYSAHFDVSMWGLFGLPPEASRFIEAFDSGEAVEPFSFQVEVPDGL